MIVYHERAHPGIDCHELRVQVVVEAAGDPLTANDGGINH